MSALRTEARFPSVDAKAGHYESFYIKAAEPRGGRALWIRHTVHKRPGAELTGSLWLTLFDSGAPGPRAGKATFGAAEIGAGDGVYIRIDGASFEPGHAAGAIQVPDLEASWDLGFEDASDPLHHLPYERLYRTSLPKTKLLSPYPTARFTGEALVGGERIAVEGWPGMVGHNWGAEHAERWVWLQASDLGGRAGDHLDVAAGRIKIGPFTTPWVANGRIVLEGESFRLGGLDRVYGTEVSEQPTSCDFALPGKRISVRGKVSAPAKDFVAWVYADPKGPEHNTLNCSIADMELTVERPGRSAEEIRVIGAAAYELGTRDTDHGIPLQPYGDG